MSLPKNFVPYSRWSPRPKGATPDTHPIGATQGVTLHWEGPHMGHFEHAQCAFKVRVIQRFHIVSRGWADIAYNAVVCPHGVVFGGRGPWTTSAANGDTESNDTHYAVCYLGGVGDGFTEAGKRGFHEAVNWLRDSGGAGPEVNGHRDHKATDCPGGEIYQWLNNHNFNKDGQEDIMATLRDLRGALRDALKPLKEDHDKLAADVAEVKDIVQRQFAKERSRDKNEKERDEENHPEAPKSDA